MPPPEEGGIGQGKVIALGSHLRLSNHIKSPLEGMEKILTTSVGRYRALKLIQYLARFVVLASNQKRIRISNTLKEKLRVLIGQCSLERRILQLGNVYRPLKYLLTLSPEKARVQWSDLGGALAGLVEDFSEDAFTLSRLGWLPARFANLAIYADRAWLVSLLIDLQRWTRKKQDLMQRKRHVRLLDQRPKSQELANSRDREMREEEWWLDLDGIRTMCDAGQAWCDVFDVEAFDGFIVGSALTSSILGMYRFIAKP